MMLLSAQLGSPASSIRSDAAKQRAEHRLHLQTSQRLTGAHMGTMPESQLAVRIPANIESMRLRPLSLIAVRRCVEHQNPGPGRDGDVGDHGGPCDFSVNARSGDS